MGGGSLQGASRVYWLDLSFLTCGYQFGKLNQGLPVVATACRVWIPEEGLHRRLRLAGTGWPAANSVAPRAVRKGERTASGQCRLDLLHTFCLDISPSLG